MKNDGIQRTTIKTKSNNLLTLFYNPARNLVIVDLIATDGTVGCELLRRTINETKLLRHCEVVTQ